VILYNTLITSISSLYVNRNLVCPECSGTGGKLGKCSKCNGRGVVVKHSQMGGMTVQMQTYCDKCGGRGTVNY